MGNVNQEPREVNPQPNQGCEQKCQLPDGTIRYLLKWLRDQLQQTPESDPTKKLKEDLEVLSKEYAGLPEVVAKYETAHKGFVGNLKHEAENQWEQLQKWVEDIDSSIKKPINDLRSSYKTMQDELQKARDDGERQFNSLKSCFDQAVLQESVVAASFQEYKKFEDKAKSYFTDFAALHKEAADHRKAEKPKALYGLYLEAKELWEKILGLQNTQTPQWLKQSLDSALRKLIAAKCERFMGHVDFLKKQGAAKTAQTNYDAFLGSRRKEFIREAQDV